jgi:hypothetical protein
MPSAVTVVRSCRQLTAQLRHPGQRPDGDKKPALPGGQVHQVPSAAAAAVVLVVLVVVAAAAAAVGELLQPVGVQRHGVVTQVLGHPLHREIGVPAAQHPVRGVQEAAAGEQAAQLETPGGAAQIRKHKVAGTCDAYCLHNRRLYLDPLCVV